MHPFELEGNFNAVISEINNSIHDRNNFTIPNNELFERLDEEYNKIKNAYERNGDLSNLYYINHNYYSTKIYQYLDKQDNFKAINHFLEALKNLLLRFKIRTIELKPLNNMVGTYKSSWIKINEFNINIKGENYSDFQRFVEFGLSY